MLTLLDVYLCAFVHFVFCRPDISIQRWRESQCLDLVTNAFCLLHLNLLKSLHLVFTNTNNAIRKILQTGAQGRSLYHSYFNHSPLRKKSSFRKWYIRKFYINSCKAACFVAHLPPQEPFCRAPKKLRTMQLKRRWTHSNTSSPGGQHSIIFHASFVKIIIHFINNWWFTQTKENYEKQQLKAKKVCNNIREKTKKDFSGRFNSISPPLSWRNRGETGELHSSDIVGLLSDLPNLLPHVVQGCF